MLNRPWSTLCILLLAAGAPAAALAVDPPPELRPVIAKLDTALNTAEKTWHESQAKAKEDAVKEFEKLLKAEKKKNVPLLTVELDQRIQALNKEIALLRDEPLMKANAIDARLTKGEFTAAEWDALPATVFTINANESRNSTKITIAQGMLFYVVPHPDDTWQADTGGAKLGWRGDQGGFMKLQAFSGEKLNDTGQFLSETGPLTLGPKDNKCSDNLGSLRVKIFRIH